MNAFAEGGAHMLLSKWQDIINIHWLLSLYLLINCIKETNELCLLCQNQTYLCLDQHNSMYVLIKFLYLVHTDKKWYIYPQGNLNYISYTIFDVLLYYCATLV